MRIYHGIVFEIGVAWYFWLVQDSSWKTRFIRTDGGYIGLLVLFLLFISYLHFFCRDGLKDGPDARPHLVIHDFWYALTLGFGLSGLVDALGFAVVSSLGG